MVYARLCAPAPVLLPRFGANQLRALPADILTKSEVTYGFWYTGRDRLDTTSSVRVDLSVKDGDDDSHQKDTNNSEGKSIEPRNIERQ